MLQYKEVDCQERMTKQALPCSFLLQPVAPFSPKLLVPKGPSMAANYLTCWPVRTWRHAQRTCVSQAIDIVPI
jgi:hypothetical protein